MFKIFVNTWGNYNENGADGGRWIDLPMDQEELDATLADIAEAMGDRDPEFCIHDYESDIDGLEISEMSNIDELNELAQQMEDLADYELEAVAAMLSEGYELEEAIEKAGDCIIWSDCSDMEDVARAYCDETGLLDSIPENLRNYFDFEAFGRDMSFEGQFVFTKSGDCVEII